MMNKTVKPLVIASMAAALAFSLAACSGGSSPTPTPSSSETPTATATSASASPTASAMPSSTADFSQELAEAQKAFPNLKVNEGENKNDVLLAVYAASRYVNTVYNSGYLANGSWAKNGGSGDQLAQMFGKDWSDSYRAKLDGIIADYHSSDHDTQTKASRLLMYNMFYTDSSMGNIKVPDDCSQNSVGAPSCLVEGSPQMDTDKQMTYQVNHTTGAIIVSIPFTDNVRIINNGVSGVSVVKYDIQLEMVKDPYPDAQNFRYAYIVNDIAGSWTIDWHKGE